MILRRHKLRKRKTFRRVLSLNPRRRLRAFGIGRKGHRMRPVRRLHSRYRVQRPIRNTLVNNAKPRGIGKPPWISPVGRGTTGNSKIGLRFPNKGNPTPPSQRKPTVFTKKIRKTSKVSRDIIIPYKRRYGKRSTISSSSRIPRQTFAPIAEEVPVLEEEISTSEKQPMDIKNNTEKAKKEKNKRNMKNIIGIAALGLLVVGVIGYTMKTKMQANGRTS